MQNINVLAALSYEVKEFAKNVNKASNNILAIAKISLKRSAYYLSNILRLFFLSPRLRRALKPGVFEEVKNHPPPNPPIPKFF